METRGYPVRVYQDDDGSWAAEVPDLPGCVAGGDTPDELFRMLEDAIDEWIHSAERDGAPIPQPTKPKRFSGRLVARLPVSLHEQLAWRAEQEAISLNTLLVTAVASYLSGGVPDAPATLDEIRHGTVFWDFDSGFRVSGGYKVFHYGADAGHEKGPAWATGNLVDVTHEPRHIQ